VPAIGLVWWMILVVIALDQLTKALVRQGLALYSIGAHHSRLHGSRPCPQSGRGVRSVQRRGASLNAA
jgi:hypothetical protein